MKRHSGWLAAGLLLFVVLACNLSKNGNNNNSNHSNSNSNSNKNSNTSTNTRPANAEIYIEKIRMAKDADGKPEETATTTFAPGDATIHCVINLNKAKKGTTVKFSWKAVDVSGVPTGEFKSIDYTTNSFENIVHAHLTRTTDWPKGTYEVAVEINGAFDKSVQFTVE
jgi:cytoskeletal protein RodZ